MTEHPFASDDKAPDPAPCSWDTIDLLDCDNDLCTIHREDYEKLKASGYLWVIYPDAPAAWPEKKGLKVDESIPRPAPGSDCAFRDSSRYERLKESIDEYLGEQGPDTGSGPFLRDLRKACIDLNFYHQERVDNFTTVHDYFS